MSKHPPVVARPPRPLALEAALDATQTVPGALAAALPGAVPAASPANNSTTARRLRAERLVVTAVFFAFAIGLGLWAGAIPALMRQTGLDVEGLGLALTLQTAAYIAAMALGGQLSRRIPPRRLMLAALLALMPAYALIFLAPSIPVLVLGLGAMGLAAGLLDLAMNAEGAAVERDFGRPVLLSMHAAASCAFAIGALGGSLIATHGAPGWCVLLVVAVIAPVAWAHHRLGPRREAELEAPDHALADRATAGTPNGPMSPTTPQPPQRANGVTRVGLILGLTIASEMAAQMWSARFLERQAADLAAWAGAGAAFFAGFQVIVRLLGDALRRRLGDPWMIAGSLLLAALGFLTVATSGHFAQSLLGFALVGLGTACVVPCCFALIARQAGADAAAALGLASLVAGALRLPAPLLLGAVAARWSDATAFAGVAGGLLVALALAWPRRPPHATAPERLAAPPRP